MRKGLAGLLLLAGLLPAVQAQEIWRHVGDHTQVRYADRPFAGASRIDLPRPSRRAGRGSPQVAPEEREGASPVAGENAQPLAAIVRPAAGETIRGPAGELEVRLALRADAEKDIRLVLELDGRETQWRGDPPVVHLNRVWRGEHRLRARLFDAQGRQLAESGEIHFYKREPTIFKPAP